MPNKWVMGFGFPILVFVVLLLIFALLGPSRKGQEMPAHSHDVESGDIIGEYVQDGQIPHIREGDAQFEVERRSLEEFEAWKSQEQKSLRR